MSKERKQTNMKFILFKWNAILTYDKMFELDEIPWLARESNVSTYLGGNNYVQ